MRRLRQARTRWAGASAMACLLAYLLGVGWLAPFATALLAASDSEHRVLLSINGHGASVVLAHDATRPGMQPGHEHRPVAVLLVAMASDIPGGTDHILSFPSGVEWGGSGMRWERAAPGPRTAFVTPWMDPGFLAQPCPTCRSGLNPRRIVACTAAERGGSTVLRC